MRLLSLALASLLFSTPAFAAPQTLTASWVDVANNEDGFQVWKAGAAGPHTTKMCDVAANTSSCQFTDDPSTNPCYVLVAYNSWGVSGDTPKVCLQPPQTPTNFTIH